MEVIESAETKIKSVQDVINIINNQEFIESVGREIVRRFCLPLVHQIYDIHYSSSYFPGCGALGGSINDMSMDDIISYAERYRFSRTHSIVIGQFNKFIFLNQLADDFVIDEMNRIKQQYASFAKIFKDSSCVVDYIWTRFLKNKNDRKLIKIPTQDIVVKYLWNQKPLSLMSATEISESQEYIDIHTL